jgi:hypothetical protein
MMNLFAGTSCIYALVGGVDVGGPWLFRLDMLSTQVVPLDEPLRIWNGGAGIPSGMTTAAPASLEMTIEYLFEILSRTSKIDPSVGPPFDLLALNKAKHRGKRRNA